MAMEIKNPWLIWIGSEHYESFDVYAEEAKRLGVSKRLPGVGMGKALLEPGTVVFLAHDDGEKTECNDCLRTISCPDCRKRRREIRDLQVEIDELKAQYSSAEALEKSGFARRSLKIRQAKIDAINKERCECPVCDGEGKAELGSGGYVKLNNGKVWDYRTYNYWLHQPEHFDAEKEVKEKCICDTCGGLGTVPAGKIRGMFIPERVEYISRGSEGEAMLERVEDFTIIDHATLRKEERRKCGKRHPGGVYAATSKGSKPSKRAVKVVDELVSKGVVEEGDCEVVGSLVVFKSPIDISGTKRFRGIKRWALDPAAEREASRSVA